MHTLAKVRQAVCQTSAPPHPNTCSMQAMQEVQNIPTFYWVAHKEQISLNSFLLCK